MAVHRQTPVSEVLASSSKRQPLLLHADVTLRAAARQANERHDVHTIAVVDDEGRLVGILPVNSLIDDVFADLVPEGYLSSVGSVSALFSTAFLLAVHRTVGEIMNKPVSVALGDTAETAFLRMHGNNLRGIPVVDEANRVTGYIDLLGLLVLWMEQGPGEADPADGAASGAAG